MKSLETMVYRDYWNWPHGNTSGKPSTGLFVLLRAKQPGTDLHGRVRQYWADHTWVTPDEFELTFWQRDSGCRFSVCLQPGPLPRQDPVVAAGITYGPDRVVVVMGTLRPPVFPLEVLEALDPLARALNLEMALPQDVDPAFGPWSPSRVLLAWRNRQRTTLAAWLGQPCHVENYIGGLPAAQIEAIWRWNRSRGQREADLKEDVFIPLIDYVDLGEGPRTRVAWPDGIPIYLPRVDFILAGLGSKPDAPPGTPETMTWVAWEALAPVLARYPTLLDFPGSRRLVYDDPPDDLMAVFRSGLRVRQAPWVVPFGRVLAEEVLTSIRNWI